MIERACVLACVRTSVVLCLDSVMTVQLDPACAKSILPGRRADEEKCLVPQSLQTHTRLYVPVWSCHDYATRGGQLRRRGDRLRWKTSV